MVMRSWAFFARSSVSFWGFEWLRSMPTSCMTVSTSGWTRSPGLRVSVSLVWVIYVAIYGAALLRQFAVAGAP